MNSQTSQPSDVSASEGISSFNQFLADAGDATAVKRKLLWRELLARHKGGAPFDIEYEATVITVRVLSDEKVRCEMGCCQKPSG